MGLKDEKCLHRTKASSGEASSLEANSVRLIMDVSLCALCFILVVPVTPIRLFLIEAETENQVFHVI